jgi:enoyl-CoA hydratase
MKTLLLERKGPVAWVWLDRRRRLNAMDGAMLAELGQTFEELDQDKAVRATVEAVFDTIENCAKPVIAAVRGAAMGGGLLLVLVADLCLAAEGATFGAPEVKIGIFPNLRLIPRLERIIGLRTAKRMVLLGEPVDAAEARSLGLVERVVPGAELRAEAQTLAEQLAGSPSTAVQVAKATFARSHEPGFIEWERRQFAVCWDQPERKVAMDAFLQARRKR